MSEVLSPSGPDDAEGALRLLLAVGSVVDAIAAAPRIQDVLPEVLRLLGEAAGVSRATVAAVEGEGGVYSYRSLHTWPAGAGGGGVPTDMRAAGYGRWIDRFSAGEAIFGKRDEVPEPEAKVLEAEGVTSFLAVPVMVSGSWWGWIGLDDVARVGDWSEAEIAAVRVAAGAMGSAIGRERLGSEARVARAQFEALVENLPAMVYVDLPRKDYETIYLSHQVQDLFGVTPEEWMADNEIWDRHVHPDDRQENPDFYSNTDMVLEYRMIRPDGEIIWIRERSATILGDDGEPEYELGTMMDITAQKSVEEAHEFQAKLLESISDAAIAYDTNMTVTAWNRAAQGLYGWTAEEIIGKPLPDELVVDPDAPGLITEWDPYIEAAGGWVCVVEQRDRDGNLVPVETKGIPLRDQDGAITSWVLVNRERLDR